VISLDDVERDELIKKDQSEGRDLSQRDVISLHDVERDELIKSDLDECNPRTEERSVRGT